MRENIDFGIDLGTTNSAIAVVNGMTATVVRDPANAEFTPSVVHVTRSGNVLVGTSVVAKAVSDAENTATEFKLRMGRRDSDVWFEASGTEMSPEELSAQVLMALRGNVSVSGEQLDGAVITVPAAFTLDQNSATMKAAELAGLRTVHLLQEPTAAAWAYLSEERSLPGKAFWLVYDFGGGTFDAAVVKIEDGEFSVVNHAGDNALGGKRIDWALVEEVLNPALHAADPSRPAVTLENENTLGALARLKGLAESAKIQLSARDEVHLEDDIEVDGVVVPFSCTVTRAQLEAVARESVAASVRHCRKALADARLDTADVSRVLLVGGTSKMTLVREMVADLGIPLDHSQDPITVVARGAAYYAATLRLPENPDEHTDPETVRLHLDVPAAGQDDDPLAGGRAESAAVTDWTGWTVELRSGADAATGLAWSSGKVSLGADGVFRTRLQTLSDGVHEFTVVLRDPTGTEAATDRSTVTHRRLAAKGDGAARAIRNIGVGLANNEVQVLIAEGDELPSTGRAPDLRTSGPISRADSGVLQIPILEGNHARADRNRVVGRLDLRREDFTRDVPAGSEVEVELSLDTSFQPQGGTAYFPLLDQEFPIHVDPTRPVLPDADELEARRADLGRRYDDLREQAAGLGPEAAAGLDRFDSHGYLAEADRLLRQAAVDPDAVSTCHDFLLEVESALDDAEEALDLPRLVEEARSVKATATEIVTEFGTREQLAELTKAKAELDRALADADHEVIKVRIDEVRTIASTAIPADVIVRAQFANLEDALTGDTRPEVTRLLAEGRAARVRGDVSALGRVNSALRSYAVTEQDLVGPSSGGAGPRPGVVGVERRAGR